MDRQIFAPSSGSGSVDLIAARSHRSPTHPLLFHTKLLSTPLSSQVSTFRLPAQPRPSRLPAKRGHYNDRSISIQRINGTCVIQQAGCRITIGSASQLLRAWSSDLAANCQLTAAVSTIFTANILGRAVDNYMGTSKFITTWIPWFFPNFRRKEAKYNRSLSHG